MPTKVLKLATSLHLNQRRIFNHPARFKVIATGRRFGKTEGCWIANADMQMREPHSQVWVDVTLAKAREYVDRIAMPLFKDFPKDFIHHHQTKHTLSVGKGTIDYYGADEPSTIEGSKQYHATVNEAGIVFRARNGRYLWQNAIRPMLMDTRGTAYIAGTPKGKKSLDGKPSMFYDLFSRSATIITSAGEIENAACTESNAAYQAFQFSTYDNPFLSATEIEEVIAEVPAAIRRQEIFGEFLDSVEVAMLKREWWKRYRTLTAGGYKVHSWDTAVKMKQTNDFNACTMWNVSPNEYQMYDLWMKKCLPPETLQAIKDFAERDKPMAILIEEKSAGEVFIPMLKSETRLPIIPIMPQGDKVQRAGQASLSLEAGKVSLPQDAAWVADFIDRAELFPYGEHDDDIDSWSQFLIWAASHTPSDTTKGRVMVDNDYEKNLNAL